MDFPDKWTDLGACPLCAGLHGFSLKKIATHSMWDVEFPADLVFGDWEGIKLLPVTVPMISVTCDTCGGEIHVVPSFVLTGTTLTVTAVAMLALLYETTSCSWRKMVDKLCNALERIAHSTPFRAVRGLGQSLQVQDVVRQLKALCHGTKEETVDWGPVKSRKSHTIDQECSVRNLLAPLLPHISRPGFLAKLLRYVDGLHILFRKLHLSVVKIYPRRNK